MLFERVEGSHDDLVEAMCLMTLLGTFPTHPQVPWRKCAIFGASKSQNARD